MRIVKVPKVNAVSFMCSPFCSILCVLAAFNCSFSRGGGELAFKGGYNARTRKQVKRVVFLPTVDVCAYIEKGVKNSRIWKKGMFFNPWNCDTCLGYNIHSRDQNKKITLLEKGILNSTMHYLFRTAKTDKNTCLEYFLVGGNTCLGSIL